MKKWLLNMVVVFLLLMVGFSTSVFAEGPIDRFVGSLEEDRMAANEELARAHLLTIQVAFEAYSFNYNKSYPKSLTDLTESNPPYIPDFLAEGVNMGYKYEIVDSSGDEYLVVAYPDSSLPPKFSGRYVYCIMKDGLIREAPAGVKIDSYDTAKKLKVVK